ncbi:hypothetical protein [Kribbella sp. NPDC004875]|uniref:hypothetical protein n=1 Tax=Kribbella sp. NPDC004875 TaxID=3364107 RepID=UPI00367D2F0A
MFSTPLSSEFVKAETAYRQERARRSFRPVSRQQAERASQPEPRHARRTLRPTTVA